MENDVLKNKLAPWQEKGRWYHGVVNISSPPVLVQEKTDSFLLDHALIAASSGSILIVFRTATISIIDCKFRLSGITQAANSGFNEMYFIYADGREGVAVAPSAANSGESEFWIFIVEE